MKLADRRYQIDSSGIRKVFDLAAKLKNPCNLSIGLPDFDAPDAVKEAAIAAIRGGKNRYTQTAGVPALRERLKQLYADRGRPVEDVLVASGTSGGLLMAFMALLNPGDEVMITDPYFVMYKSLPQFLGAVPRFIDLYPDFRLRREALEAAWSPKCKMLVLNSPNNPTGAVFSTEELKMVAKFAEEKDLVVVSDEIYEEFSFDGVADSLAAYTDPARTIVISGLSKSAAVTGWRLGWITGPKDFILALSDIQQYSFVCAPSMAQEATFVALEHDMAPARASYTQRRDTIYNGLVQAGYNVVKPGGAFYIFPEAPGGDGEAFVKKAIENELLIIPGSAFSQRNTHFRISFATSIEQLNRGIGILADIKKHFD
ncbi:MAG: aminotransferase [Candidatus Sumerlaeota bacterium]|nr:aminotransferase [Candidatus Sumerlaeota bacterium]